MTLVPTSLAAGWADVAICPLAEPAAALAYVAAWRAAEASPALHRCLALLSALVDERFTGDVPSEPSSLL
jgi:DNA-binding transcriptional LysR family regulator